MDLHVKRITRYIGNNFIQVIIQRVHTVLYGLNEDHAVYVSAGRKSGICSNIEFKWPDEQRIIFESLDPVEITRPDNICRDKSTLLTHTLEWRALFPICKNNGIYRRNTLHF